MQLSDAADPFLSFTRMSVSNVLTLVVESKSWTTNRLSRKTDDWGGYASDSIVCHKVSACFKSMAQTPSLPEAQYWSIATSHLISDMVGMAVEEGATSEYREHAAEGSWAWTVMVLATRRPKTVRDSVRRDDHDRVMGSETSRKCQIT